MEVNKPEFSKKQVAWIIGRTAVATFVLTGIFFRFEAVEKKVVELFNADQYTNERVDKKTARNKELIDANKAEIEKLKQPNSDK